MEKVIELIKNANDIVILPHINADGDAIGSCKAMQTILKRMGKDSMIYIEEPTEKRLGFIADGIFLYKGEEIKCGTCIVLDSGDTKRVGKRWVIAENADTVINIDHHITNTLFGDASYVVADASATGEVLYDICLGLGVEIDYDIARYLYTAICSDTGGFAYSNVSPKTFNIAAELIKLNIHHEEVSRLLFDTVDIKSELVKAELVKSLKRYADGKICLVKVSREFASDFGIGVEDVEDVIDVPRRIRGTEIAIALKEKDDRIRISLRSNGEYNVADIALKFDGGGHAKAAGGNIYTSLDEAEKLIVKACEEIL